MDVVDLRLRVAVVAVFKQERTLVIVNNPFSCVPTACFMAVIPFRSSGP